MGLTVLALAMAVGDARADGPPPDATPGSPRPPGMGLSPEAPHVPPAPGGRAPSFGAPVDDGAWSFAVGGRIAGFEAFGFGRTPSPLPSGYQGSPLHIPPLIQGRAPFFPGAGGSLFLQYGNPIITAFVSLAANISSPQYVGYSNPSLGPSIGYAYVVVTPEPVGDWHLAWRLGAFVDSYAGPGQWGWGIFGPMLSIRGYGETTSADIDLATDWHLSLNHGVVANPGVAENFIRGDYNSWFETGVSSYVHHAHAGVTYKNLYTFRLHYASDYGTDERQALPTLFGSYSHPDGRMDAFLFEARLTEDPYGHGQLGITAGLYNFVTAAPVFDGIWWGIDYTQGARDMMTKFIGPRSNGTGKVAVVSAEYDTSIARILWYPRGFDGNAPDLSVRVASMNTWTVATGDPSYQQATGYYLGAELEYKMLPWFSATFQGYAESRDSILGRYEVFSLNPGIRFHSDWLSADSIQIIYSRRFYSQAVDFNPAAPLDRDLLMMGGYYTF